MPSALLQYYNTARHLKGRQIAGQISNRTWRKLENPAAFFDQETPAYPGSRWAKSVVLPPPPKGMPQPFEAGGKFTFLNQAVELGWPPRWDSPDLSRLWLYNLHYFEWLWELDWKEAVRAVTDWITHHPLERGRIGWEPYPTSLRLMNWTDFFFGHNRAYTEADTRFADRLWRSLCLQADWLCRHLEYHLLANHLFENAAALALAGSCFRGAHASRWRTAGLRILRREMEEQVLADGVHFERSPMYHSRILYVLLLLAATGDEQLAAEVKEPICRMAGALAKLTHPDKCIALLNDSAFGISHEPGELLTYASTLFTDVAQIWKVSCGWFALKDAGYYGWRSPEGHYLICDAGPIGPDYQPGHAHADVFSFELSLCGRRVIVDGGVYGYEPGEDRDYCRSTRAHNTVEVMGQNQCEMWGSHRVARRARVRILDWRPSDDGFMLQAVHNGYERLRSGLRHSRRFVWKAEGCLDVTDSIENMKAGEAVSQLHLNPECHVDRIDGNMAFVSLGSIRLQISFRGAGGIEAELGSYYPEFGRKIQNRVLVFHPESGVSKWSCEIRLC